jgi:hypothetical protein
MFLNTQEAVKFPVKGRQAYFPLPPKIKIWNGDPI